MSRKTSSTLGFIFISLILLSLTGYFALHWVNLLFGENSIQVYDGLKHKKDFLEREITRLQKDNARLQKEYFELKNLEPEE